MSTPTAIAATFAELKSGGQMAFMPFVTAGDPDLKTTLLLIRELASRSVDLIEVGFPYSDPIADGPVIQASYTRALQHDVRVSDIFTAIRSLSNEQIPPLVAMVSYALVFRNGAERFVQQAKSAGFAGLIIPDLPGDEAAEFAELVKTHGLDLIQLIAPTTPPERAKRILQTASGFVYCIAVSGTTGVRDALPAELRDQLAWLREETDLPLAVGFGISKPDQIQMLRGVADGIIVGSAIVQQMESLTNDPSRTDATLAQIGVFAGEMAAATKA